MYSGLSRTVRTVLQNRQHSWPTANELTLRGGIVSAVSGQQQRERSIYPRYSRYKPLALISLLWFLVQFLRFAFPPLFGTFQAEYDVSNTSTGLLFTALMIAYAAMQFPAGAISDQIGRPRSIAIGGILFGSISIMLLFASNFEFVFILAVLMGVTTAGHKTISINMISNRYADQVGLGLGVLDTVGQFGGVAAPIGTVIFLSTIGWEWTFAIAGGCSIILAVFVGMRVTEDRPTSQRQHIEAEDSEETLRKRYLTLISNSRLLTFMIVTMTFTFAWNGVSSFLPLYLVEEKGLITGSASLLYSVFFIVSLSQLVTGKISDSIGQLWVGLGTFILMILTVASLLVVDGVIAVSIVTLLLGTAFHSFRPVRDSYLMTLVPDDIGGGSLGIIRTGMVAVGSVAPAIVGYLADLSGFQVAFSVILFAVCLGGTLTGVLLITR